MCLQFAQVAKEASALLLLRPRLADTLAAHRTMRAILGGEDHGGRGPCVLAGPSRVGDRAGALGAPQAGDGVNAALAACSLDGAPPLGPVPTAADIQRASDRLRSRLLRIMGPELARLQGSALAAAQAAAAQHGVPWAVDGDLGPSVEAEAGGGEGSRGGAGEDAPPPPRLVAARRRAYPAILAACKPFFELYRLAQLVLGDGMGPGLVVTPKWS